MKTFQKFNEDIEQRRQIARQNRLDQIEAHRERVASYQELQRKKRKQQKEREEIKQELARELQNN